MKLIGDGIADDTVALRQLFLSSSRSSGDLPAGIFIVSDTLIDTPDQCRSYAVSGPRPQRGCNAGTASCIIRYRPKNPTKPLIRIAAAAGVGTIGPYIHKNICFDLGGNDGFIFGIEDLDGDGKPDPMRDGWGQAYINGVRFEGCDITADPVDRNSRNGVLRRSGRTMIRMAKCFESSIRDTSLYGSDVQVRTYGCDCVSFDDFRSQASHLPFDLVGSGTFASQHRIGNGQVEDWTFAPIRSTNCEIASNNLKLEQNDGNPAGSGRYALPGTVAIAADTNTLTFSESMAGVIRPGLSLVEVTDGEHTQTFYPLAVSGRTVTVDVATNLIYWSASSAKAVRIHGHGPIHRGSYTAHYSNVACDASTGCPAFVYQVGRGSLKVVNAAADIGIHGALPSLIVGNRPAGQHYMDGGLVMVACSPSILAPPGHPYLSDGTIGGNRSAIAYNANQRPSWGDTFDALGTVERRWILTPQRTGSVADGSALDNPVVAVKGEPGETIFAWLKRDPKGVLHCPDDTLPSTPGMIRLRIKARSLASTGELGYYFGTDGAGSLTTTVPLTDRWTVHDVTVPLPAEWSTLRNGGATVTFTGAGYYLAAVAVEEVPSKL